MRSTLKTMGRPRGGRRVPFGHALLHLLTILSLVVSLFGLGVPAALAAPTLTFTPPSKDFGPVQIGKTSAVQVFAIQNTSTTESVTITDVTALVDNAANGTFNITANSCTLNNTTPVTLAAGQSCQVNVDFSAIQSPLPPDPPVTSGTLYITSNELGMESIPLSATVVTPTPTYTPSSLSFGNQLVNTISAAQTITVRNTTGTTFKVNTVQFVGYDPSNPATTGISTNQFVKPVDNCTGATLTPNDTCTVGVSFSPTSIGYKIDRLRFETNAPFAGNVQDVIVDGTAINPTLSVSPASLAFSQPLGTTSAKQTITVTNNTGNAVILGTSATTAANNPGITGTGTSSFAIAGSDCADGATLANGASCTIDLTYTAPTTAGTQAATVTLAYRSAAGDAAVSAGLTGNAVAPGGPVASVNPPTITFPDTQVSTVSQAVPVTITNTGGSALTFTSAPSIPTANNGDATAFAIVANGCGATLAAGASCTVTVRFTPGTAAGAQSSTLQFADDAPGSPQVVNLTGTATAAAPAPVPFATLSTGGLAFGTVQQGQTSGTQAVTLTNTGGAPLTFTAPTAKGRVNPDDFTIDTDTCTGTLAAGASCTVTVRFAPAANATGNRSATLQFADDSAGGTPQVVTLNGTASATPATAPQIAFDPAAVAFGGQAVGATTSRTLTVTNTGTAPLVIAAVGITGGNAGDFAANGCVTTLAPGGQCTVTITFTPSATGNRASSVQFTDNAPNGTAGNNQVVPLSGTGTAAPTAAQATVSPASVAFGGIQIGQSSPVQTLTLTNTGGSPLTVSAPVLTGPNGPPLNTDFTYTYGGSTPFTFNTCPATGGAAITLAPGASCAVGVRFTPTAAGERQAVVVFPTSAGNPSVPLTGVGVTANVQITPSSVDFGGVQTGTTSPARTLTVTNNGSGPVVLLGIAQVAGSPFTVQPNGCPGLVGQGQTLQPGESCTVGVTFAPAANQYGPVSGALTFNFNATVPASGATTFSETVSLTGVGLNPAAVATPATLNFGSVPTGQTSAPLTVTLANPGGTTTTITGVPTITGTNFAAVGGTCTVGVTLSGASTCTVNVTFSPTAVQTYTGTLNIPTSAGTVGVALYGVGSVGTLSINPVSLDFGAVTAGNSAVRTVTVSNNGTGNIILGATAATIAGTGYAIAGDTCEGRTLAPGESCQIGVRFAPTAAAAVPQTGTLTVTTADGAPQTVGLTGQATSPVLTFTPAAIDFGAQQGGTTATRSALVTNNSGGAVTITSIDGLVAPFALVGNACGTTPLTLAAGASCAVTVAFAPSATGYFADTLDFTLNNGPTQTLAVSGTSTPAPTPAVSIAPASLDFGTVATGTTTGAQTVRVTNTGAGPLAISNVTIANPATPAGANDFRLGTNTCANGLVLQQGEFCDIAVTFTPAATGQRVGTLTITDNAQGGSQTVTLLGNGAQNALTVTPDPVAFGNQGVGVARSLAVTVANPGTTAVQLGTPTITGAGYTVSGGDCANSTLTAGSRCTIAVTFTPTATTSYAGTLTVPYTPNGGTAQTATVALSGAGVSTTLTITPNPLDFGRVTAGSQSVLGVSIVNNGPGNVAITTVTVTNTAGTGFILDATTCTGLTLAPGVACNAQIRFAPTAAGNFNGTIDVNLAGGGVVQGALTGIADPAPLPAVSIVPGSLDFGATQTGTTSAARTITVTNSGTAPLVIGAVGITFGGAVFADLPDGCENATLAPGASCTVAVVFRPTAAGFQTGTLTLNDNAGTGKQDISLTGSGVDPTFALSAAGLGFGNQQRNTASPVQTVTLTNSTTGPLTITGVALDTPVGPATTQYAVVGDTCLNGAASKTIAPRTSCTIGVQFRPTALGEQRDTLAITYTGTDTTPVTVGVALTGTGVSATATVTPATLDFGTVAVGTTSAAQTITFTNTGSGPIAITGADLDAATTTANQFSEISDGCTGKTIAPGASCTIAVAFKPTAQGNSTGTYVIATDAGNFAVSLRGQGTTGNLDVTPGSLDFGTQQTNTASPVRAVTVTNNTGKAVTIATTVVTDTAPTAANPATQFGLFANGCAVTPGTTNPTTITLGDGQSCTLGVRFTPTSAGTKTGTLTITSDAPGAGATQTVALTGLGIDPALGVTPASLDFAAQQVNTASATQTVTVKNIGTGPATIDGVALSGPVGGGASQFTILDNTCAVAGGGGPTGVTLAEGQSCTIGVRFTPTTAGGAGFKAETLNIDSNAPVAGSVVSVGLTGTATNESLGIAPPVVDFGSQQIQTTSAPRTVTITNNGTGPVRLLNNTPGIDPSSANPTSFAQSSDCVNATLLAGQSCTIAVTFTPTATGLLTATILVADDRPNGTSQPIVQTIVLRGTGVAPNFSLSANGFDFGNVQVGQTSAPQTITLTNSSGGPLTVGTVALPQGNASEYLLTGDLCSGKVLADGATCTIGVRFRPTSLGARPEVLYLTYQNGAQPQRGATVITVPIGLTGVGVSPAFNLSASALDFGNVQIGSVSAVQTITLTNSTNGPLTLNPAAILGTGTPPLFRLTGDTCSGKVIPGGTTCQIGVQFLPAAPGGPQNGTLRLSYLSGASGTPQATTVTLDVALSGVAVTPALAVTPTSLTFAPQQLGIDSPAQTVTVKNIGLGPVTIGALSAGGAGSPFVLVDNLCTGQTLEVGATCTVGVLFRGTTAGTFNGTLTITSDAPVANTLTTVGLVGTATNATVSVSAPGLDFGGVQVGTTGAPQTITVTNNGSGPVLISGGPTLGGTDATDFALSTGCNGTTLQPGGSCAITVTFRPTAAGPRTATIALTDAATGSPRTLTLRGTGIDPTFSVTPGALNFGDVQVGQTGAAQTITFQNTTGGPLTFDAAAFSNVAGGTASAFSASGDSCSGKTIQRGATCTISVIFRPTAVQRYSETLTITYGDGKGGTVTLGVALTGNGVDQAIGVGPASLDFGNVQVNAASAAQTVTITNRGAGPLTFNGATLDGVNAGDFEIVADSCTTSALPVGGTCPVAVRFSPTATGPKVAQLVLSSDAPTSPTRIGLSGVGVSAGFGLSPTGLTFPSSQVGATSPVQTVTITNRSTGPLSVAGIGILTNANSAGGDFLLSGPTCENTTIAAGESCQIGVVFTPTKIGTRNATLRIRYNNGAADVALDVRLSGLGTNPSQSIAPASLDFGYVQVGSTSAAQSVTITNTGTGPLNLTSATISPAGTAFTIVDNGCVGQLLPGASCTVGVIFKPTATGPQGATLTIASDGQSAPQTIGLTGVGISAGFGLSAAGLDFGSVQVGAASPTQTITVTNNSNGPLTLGTASILSGTEYALSGDTCSGKTIAAGATCTIGVQFRPSAGGGRAGTLRLPYNNGAAVVNLDVALTGVGVSAGFTLSASGLTFPAQQVGTSSAAQTLTLTNSSTGPLTLGNAAIVNGTGAEFVVSGDTCSGKTIAAGATCTVGIVFTPSATGARSATLQLGYNNGTADITLGVALTGTGVSAGFGLSAAGLDFGNVQIGATSGVQTLTLTNSSTGALTLGAASIVVGGEYALSGDTCSGRTIAAGATCTVGVIFTPSAGGTRNGTLRLAYSSGTTPVTVDVALTGVGVSGGLTIAPSALSFADQFVGTTSAPQTITITNSGAGPTTLTAFAKGGTGAADFIVSGTNCGVGTTLGAGQRCTLTVSFAPQLSGARSATITVTDAASGQAQTIALSGVATVPAGPAVVVSSPSLTFADQQVLTTSATQTITVTNGGRLALGITGATITGTDANDFLLTGNTCDGANLAPNAQGTPNQSCAFGVSFRPTATGSRTATVTLTTNAGTVTLALTGVGLSSTVEVTPSSLDFGAQAIGVPTAARAVTVTNTGAGTLTVASLAITGTNASDFTIGGDTCSGATFRTTCTFGVIFTPSAPGQRRATLTITDSATGSPRTIPLSGQGVSGAIGISASALSFDDQQVGTTSPAKTVTITNNGPAGTTLTIADITISGTNEGDFTRSGNACTGVTLAAGATCQVGIVFTPSAGGARSATLSIASDAPGGPQTIALSGNGITSGLGLSTTSLSFGAQPLGTQGPTRTVTVTNTGSQTITIGAVAVGGTAATEFVLYGNTCAGGTPTTSATLAAGATCEIDVAFKPAAPGNRVATLQLTDTAPGSPHTIQLLGVGVSASVNFSTASLDFGTQQVGSTSAAQTVTLQNTSGAAISVVAGLNGTNQGEYTKTLDTCNGATLANGESCAVTVRFAPTAPGSRPSSLLFSVVNTGNGTNTNYLIGLNGTGVTGQLTFSPANIAFGAQPLTTTSGFQAITLTNGGSGAVTINSVGLGGDNPGDFVLDGSGCNAATLGLNGRCTVNVAFRPTAVGSRLSSVNFSVTVGGATVLQSVVVSGTGTTTPAPVLTITPAGLTFGPQQLTTTSGVQTIVIGNTGTAALILGPVTLTGPNGNDFAKTADTCSNATVVAPGGTCAISVRFTPSAGGTRTANLSFATNTAAGAQSLSLIGTGTTPNVLLSRATLDFGQQQQGTTSGARTITLTNTGNGTLTLGAITVGGTDANDFAKAADTCSSAILGPGDTCTIGATFTPTQLGSRAGALLIVDNAPGAPHRIALIGAGTATPTASVNLSATSLSFGPVQIGTASIGQTLTVTNGGNDALTITSALIGGDNASDFRKTGDTCSGATIPAGNSCTVGVVFQPTAAGNRNATILLIDSAAGSPRTIILSGAGVTGAVGLSAASFDFGQQPIGAQGPAQTLTVTNTGGGVLRLGPVTITGAGAGDYVLLGNTCDTATLAAGASCQIGIAFKPSATGSRDATLQVFDTAAGSGHGVALHGTGTPPVAIVSVTIATGGVGGTVGVSPASPYGSTSYNAGTLVTLRATPLPNYLFTGWRLNGQYVGFANPLTVTLDQSYTVEAQFVPRLAFSDTGSSPYLNAITELASRGIIRGYGDGNFGPRDTTLRAQMAALIARAMGWEAEDHGNTFSDRNGVDGDLWRNVGTLAFYNVARGYRDNTYDPTGKVLYAQAISFITRAMVEKGYWEFQPDPGTVAPNVPENTGHRQDIVTYLHYVGPLPGTTSPTADFPNWDQPTTREWFAESLWRALNSYFGTDRVP